MKTSLLPNCRTLAVFTFILLSVVAQAQSFNEMIFENPVLESGGYGKDGSSYRFSNICTGVDAVVTIKGRSDAMVTLSSMDTTGPGMGYDKAFQPSLGIEGTTPANSSWWMDFGLTFYESGTNNPVTATEFYATGLDIDGDGLTINEWAEMYKTESIDSALINSLTFKRLSPYFQGYDYRIEGIIANSPGIDTTAKNVMATYRYANKSHIDFRIGANSSASTSTAGMRLNSIWFKKMQLGNPLPVKLVSFTASLDNSNVNLKWTTATESNLKEFDIERSNDNKNFVSIVTVNANGNTSTEMNYNYTDIINDKNSSVLYYRLRSVDLDGKSEYSATRIIKRDMDNSSLSILTYPNPASDELRISIPANWQNKNVVYELYAASGQAVKVQKSITACQTETINISSLNRGIYIAKVSCEGSMAQQKIIKN